MSLAQLWATLRAAWPRIALMVLVAAAIAFALASALPKQYSAKARVMLNIDNTDPNQYSQLRRGMAEGYIATEMRLVADDAVTRDVVRRLGWPDNPQVIGEWQAQTDGVGDVTAWAATQLARNIAVRELEDSSILEIYYSSSSLDAAKQIVAVIRSAYIDQSQVLRAAAARRASAWNRTQATRALAVVHAAEAARAKFVTANQIAIDTPHGGLDYQAQATAMTQSATTIKPPAAAAAGDATTYRLTRQLDTLDGEIAVLRLRGESNPATVALVAQRDSVAQQLAREKAVSQSGPSATANQIGLVRAQRDADYLQARLHLLDRAPLYDELARLDRDIALKVRRYNAAAARVADFDQIAAAPSGLRVVGDIIADDEASFPNIPVMTALAAGASLAFGIAIALLAELGRRQVRGVEDLTFFAGVPVLAVIAADAPRGWWRSIAGRLDFRRRRRRTALAASV